MFNFVFDQRNDTRPYPNLAPMMHNPHQSYHGMGDVYPFIAPCRLLLYCKDHDFPMRIHYVNEGIPNNSFYPVGLAWFDFDLDYFSMMSTQVHNLLKQGQMKVLFYYHEGDNPFKEKQRLDELCNLHKLPTTCYKFVSGNTQANNISNFFYFPDHELFYWRNSVKWNNKNMPGCSYHTRPRSRQFTALNRFHKWWRATIMADLHRNNLLTNSYWSYNNIDMGDQIQDNPIRIDSVNGLRQYLDQFLKLAPYHCDDLTEQEHNSHWMFVPEHFNESYCHLVFETLYDAEQSHGTFLSEKIFKPIRHAQPFVIFGTPNTLFTLRKLGYRTFDHAINNDYDSESDNTARYSKTFEAVKTLSQTDLQKWYVSCRNDILHNQELFLSSKYERLNTLLKHLLHD